MQMLHIPSPVHKYLHRGEPLKTKKKKNDNYTTRPIDPGRNPCIPFRRDATMVHRLDRIKIYGRTTLA